MKSQSGMARAVRSRLRSAAVAICLTLICSCILSAQSQDSKNVTTKLLQPVQLLRCCYTLCVRRVRAWRTCACGA